MDKKNVCKSNIEILPTECKKPIQQYSLFCTKVKNSDFSVTGFTYTVYKSALLSETCSSGRGRSSRNTYSNY